MCWRTMEAVQWLCSAAARHHVSIMYYDDVGQLSLAVSLVCIVIV